MTNCTTGLLPHLRAGNVQVRTLLDWRVLLNGYADQMAYEADVLAGLSRPVPAISFEFTTIQREVAYACLGRLAALGDYRFNIALGESQVLTFADGVTVAEMAAHIRALPHEANSGDVYAVLGGRV